MEWLEGLANELQLRHLSARETEQLLTASREVAHRIERRTTPLAMYLVGVAVGRQLEQGRDRDEAMQDAVHAVILRLPSPPDDELAPGVR